MSLHRPLSRVVSGALAAASAPTILASAILFSPGLLPPAFAAGTAAPSASAAFGSAPPVPGSLSRWSGILDYAGKVGGLPTWSIRSHGGLVMLAPDGASVIFGNVYGPRGQDIGAVYSGSVPTPLSDLLDLVASSVIDMPDEDGDTGQAGGDGEDIGALPGEQRPGAGGTAAPASSPSSPSPASGLPDTPPPPAPAGSTAGEAVAGGTGLPAQISGTGSPSGTLTGAEDENQKVSVEKDTFWMVVGNPEAPAVYAFIDPTCPYCATSMVKLKDEVEQGRLQLRVVLVPFRSRESIALAASMLTDKEPPVAFWRHEIERGTTGKNGIDTADPASIGNNGIKLLERNIMFMRDQQIRGTPFFVWAEPDGWKTAFGVAEPDTFSAAMTRPLPEKTFMNFPEGLSPLDEGASAQEKESAAGEGATPGVQAATTPEPAPGAKSEPDTRKVWPPPGKSSN